MVSSGLSVEKMLCIRVFYFVSIWVGDVIWGSKDDEYISSRNWTVLGVCGVFQKVNIEIPH